MFQKKLKELIDNNKHVDKNINSVSFDKIDKLEKLYNLKFPDIYKKFLHIAGHISHNFYFFEELYFFENINELNFEIIPELKQDNEIKLNIEKNWFFIGNFQCEKVLFIICNGECDPMVKSIDLTYSNGEVIVDEMQLSLYILNYFKRCENMYCENN